MFCFELEYLVHHMITLLFEKNNKHAVLHSHLKIANNVFFCSPLVCLRGMKIPGKCLLVDSVKKRYHTANEDCIAKGGILSTPLTSDENTQLYDYVRQSIGPDAEIWLGINDMQTEGVWVDQTGSNIRYKNWKLPQPDGGSAENCAVLSGGKWLDDNCREERASVCEFNIV